MMSLLIKSISKPDKAAPAVKVTKAQTGQFAGLLAILAAHNPECHFGPDTVENGHTVAFKAGSFVGAGKVSAVGAQGLTVRDDDARDHQVHWHEVTGHKEAKKAKGKDAPGNAK